MLRPHQDFSQFQSAISGLSEFDISGNSLESQGLEMILKLCPPGLQKLNISSTLPESEVGSLRGLLTYCQRSETDSPCELQHLLIRECKLSDINSEELLNIVTHLRKLKSIDLSGNSMSGSVLSLLLNKLLENNIYITKLCLENSPQAENEGGEKFTSSLTEYMKTATNFKHLEITDKNSEITDRIKEQWQKIWKEAADFQERGEDTLVFTAKQ